MQAIDRKTRKLFTIYGALHPKSDVDRLYIPRKKGRRGLISIEDWVKLAIRGLEVYVHGNEERLIQAPRGNEKILEDWEEKVLHGQYFGQTKEVSCDECWAWVHNEHLKRKTESLIVAAQSQSINLVKARIDKSQGDSSCRVCRKVDESIEHIVSGCSKEENA